MGLRIFICWSICYFYIVRFEVVKLLILGVDFLVDVVDGILVNVCCSWICEVVIRLCVFFNWISVSIYCCLLLGIIVIGYMILVG